MAKNMVQARGIVRDVLPARIFRIELENGALVLATVAVRFRRNSSAIVAGDRVQLELSCFDLLRGRIVGWVQ